MKEYDIVEAPISLGSPSRGSAYTFAQAHIEMQRNTF